MTLLDIILVEPQIIHKVGFTITPYHYLIHTIVETIATILQAEGMHCLGCPSARSETLEEACQNHEIDCEQILSEINNLV